MRTSSHQTMKHTYGRASTHRAALPASFENASVKRAIIRYMLGEEEAGGVFDAGGLSYALSSSHSDSSRSTERWLETELTSL